MKCPGCDLRFTPNPRSPRQKFCSARCRDRVNKRDFTARNLQAERARKRKWHNDNYDALHIDNCKWRRENPDRVAAYAASAYAKRRGAEGRGLTNIEWLEIKRAYNFKCAYCGKRKRLTRDHVVALSNGGRHESENIVPACQSCNSRKGNKREVEPKKN